MGVRNEKSRLFHQLISVVGRDYVNEDVCPALIDEERQRVNEMVQHINKAVLEAIESQPYVSSNVLMLATATVVSTVLKLDFDMWKSDSETFLISLIHRVWWGEMKGRDIDYSDLPE